MIKQIFVVCLLALLSSSFALQESNDIFFKELEKNPSDIAYTVYATAKQIISGELLSLSVLDSPESEAKPALMAVIPRKTSELVQRNDLPILTLDASVSQESAHKIAQLLPWIEHGARLFEQSSLPTGQTMPQLTLAALPATRYPHVKFAVLDVERSTLYVREEYLADLDTQGIEDLNEAYSKVFKLFDEYTTGKGQLSLDELILVTMRIVKEIPPIMFRNIPLCFACMIVLGFALPIGWNLGLGYGFQYVCVNIFHEDPNVCATDSVLIAFAGLILVAPAAYLMVKVCVFWTGWCATKALLKF